jgi:RimJ/RimL family protein N-acetyltransferase
VTKRKVPTLEGSRIALRLLEQADLPLTLSWRNQDQIRKWFLNPTVITMDGHSTWFERYQELDNDFIFIILAKELENLPVGQISLYRINWDTKTAEFGRLMIGASRARGKGLAKEATHLLLNYGFNVMGLKEIILEVKQDNEAAIAIYRTTGFRETSRENDLVIMSVRAEH